jgi:hypothetical protein
LIGASVSRNLTLSLGSGYADQNVKIIAYNDFSAFNFSATLKADNSGDDDANHTVIIIVIILCAIVFVFFVFYIISIVKRKKQPIEER